MKYSSKIANHEKVIFTPVPDGSEAFILKDLAKSEKNGILHICKNDFYLDKIREILEFIAPELDVFEFPAWDINPYDNVSPSTRVTSKRLKALAKIANGNSKNHIILTTASACIQKNIPKDVIKKSSLSLNKGNEIKRDLITEFLVNNSYINVGAASDNGEFSLRGSIIDIFPPAQEFGIRVDFFGDEIESIRKYDPLTQISHGDIDGYDLIPASEIILNKQNIERFKENFISKFGLKASDNNPLYENIIDGRRFAGMENFLPFFYEKIDSIFDYFEGNIICLENDVQNVLFEKWSQIQDAYDARNVFIKSGRYNGVETNLIEPSKSYILNCDFDKIISKIKTVQFNKFSEGKGSTGGIVELEFKSSRNYFQDSKVLKSTALDLLEKDIKPKVELGKGRDKTKNIIACISSGSRERVAKLLTETEVKNVLIDDFEKDLVLIDKQSVGLCVLGLDSGFKAEGLNFISEAELFGEKVYRKKRKGSGKAEDFLKEAANLNSGELIVHKEHGIGRFEGLETLAIQGFQHDFILLTYKDGDKFYVPVENIELISRYGSADGVELDKLGGLGWQERTARVKKRIREIAKDLIHIAANRELKLAPAFDTSLGAYDEFASKFPYVETDDQMNAIEDVLRDMSSGKAMDRLICGDVGFGKTEVAIRAAFAAIQNNKDISENNGEREQVAFICPTTLLCRQHFNTLQSRFEGTGFRVKQLSRMVTAKEMKKTKEEIANGEVDIVVGTHTLLAKNMEFSNLSLLIIDEEQRFGVSQKERLKKLKNETHVLTLSATPIPRTLQLSLSGIRDLSLIATPPVDRLAVRTYVMPFDQITIREAIMKEHYRGGRTYYVAPRIKDLEELEAKIKLLVPEVKIVVAHGQMKPDELDQIMNDFYEGRFDVLLSTTIVESGLDVPDANTIIIHKADMFGLAQLYQLRGRVGRGKIRAYAYLTVPQRKRLTNAAEKRLEVMQKLDTLGAGFTLASYDMDIRGFGNLLGDEQSGNVKEVGVELYQNMLKEAIEGLKAMNDNKKYTANDDDFSIKINLGISVLIPDIYVSDSDLRMSLYRRLGNLDTDEEVESFAAELSDRFGTLPREVDNLLETVKIKFICKKLGINKVDASEIGARIQFHKDSFKNPDGLIGLVIKNPIKYKIKDGNKFLIMNCDWKKVSDRIYGLKEKLRELDEVTKQEAA